jgi:hypothetical protein
LQPRYKKKLTELRKYKPIIAAVLLVVYSFIATPVQFWHQHNYAIARTVSSLQPGDTQKIYSANNSAKTIEDNCRVCSHHYSIYSNDDVTGFKIFGTTINSKKGFYTITIQLAPYFNSTNKGPPALA